MTLPSQFGPSALVTPANLITVGRLVLTVPLLAMIVDGGATWPAVTLWILLCVTDGIDGLLARRQGTTRSGACGTASGIIRTSPTEPDAAVGRTPAAAH